MMVDIIVDMNMTDWSEKYADDRGIIRAAMMARKKKMSRYLSEEAFRRGKNLMRKGRGSSLA